jgi:O-antigen ligase
MESSIQIDKPTQKRSHSLLILSMAFWIVPLIIVAMVYPKLLPIITILLATVSMILIVIYPIYGVVMVMVFLYLPVFSPVRLGSIEFSVTSIPVAALATVAILRLRERETGTKWRVWQVVLLIMLGIGFFISTVLSTQLWISLLAIPNFIVYLLILFSINSLITNHREILLLAKTTVVLAFISVIWKEVDGLLGLPRLSGINSINFQHHVAFAICVSVWALRIQGFSMRWKIFMALVASLIIVDYVYYETRAAWIACILMLVLIFMRTRPSLLLATAAVSLLGLAMITVAFGDILQRNLAQTQNTIGALQGFVLDTASPDDRIRLAAEEAGLNMIRAKPWFGWGPNLFPLLKREFVVADTKALTGTSFNSWLLWMAEMGILGVLPVILTFVAPFVIILRQSRSRNSNYLAYAFSVGVMGLVSHLFFINMLYSFVWLNVGLVWAASRIVEELKVNTVA